MSVVLIVCESGPFKAPLPVSLGSLGKGFALGVGWIPCSIQKAALFIAFHRAGQPVQQRLRREANLSGVPIFTPVIPCEEYISYIVVFVFSLPATAPSNMQNKKRDHTNLYGLSLS